MYKSSRQEFYDNNNVITTISRHIENPGIVRTVYSHIFQAYSGKFRNIQPCSDILRGIKAYSGILEAYGCETLAHRTMSYSEPWLI